jgi:uncharacterized protein YbjT (DUF2867 family)
VPTCASKVKQTDNISARDLDWTIVRPSGLTDAPGTGLVRIGTDLPGGALPRVDLATVLHRVVTEPAAVRRRFDVTAGTDPIATVPL